MGFIGFFVKLIFIVRPKLEAALCCSSLRQSSRTEDTAVLTVSMLLQPINQIIVGGTVS